MTVITDKILSGWKAGNFWIVARRDEGKCVYCGLDGSKDYRLLSCFELDHLIPRDQGGNDSTSNLVLACRCCNRDKGHRDPSVGQTLKDPSNLTKEERAALIQVAIKWREEDPPQYYVLLAKAILENSN